MRIIYVPQYPTPMRYQEWWFWKFPEEFEKAGFEVITLGKGYASLMEHRRGNLSMFSPIHAAIEFETEQIREYMELQLHDDDILFWSDISFPGLFGNVLYHKTPKKMYAFCHATSINKFDYFEDISHFKFIVERTHARMFNTVFVGSKYHQDKLDFEHFSNTTVTYLPFPPIKTRKRTKKYDIVSASRPGRQKVDLQLEKKVEEKFSEIVRKDVRTWKEYYGFLANSKVLLITSHEDTFGYQIIDAILNNCIPIARNDLAYPEILPEEYLYNDEDELYDLLNTALWGQLDVPKIICREHMDKFYENIIEIMKGENF